MLEPLILILTGKQEEPNRVGYLLPEKLSPALVATPATVAEGCSVPKPFQMFPLPLLGCSYSLKDYGSLLIHNQSMQPGGLLPT